MKISRIVHLLAPDGPGRGQVLSDVQRGDHVGPVVLARLACCGERRFGRAAEREHSAAGLMRIRLPSASATKTPSLIPSRMERRTSVWWALSDVNSAKRAFCMLSRRSFSRSACSFLSLLGDVGVRAEPADDAPFGVADGEGRERNHRYSPSLTRKGKGSSHGSPVAKARWMPRARRARPTVFGMIEPSASPSPAFLLRSYR